MFGFPTDVEYIIYALGLISLIILAIIFIIGFIGAILLIYLIKTDKLLFPKLLLFIVDNLHSILLRMYLFIGSEDTFYKICIDFYNKYYHDKFYNSKKKCLILPHCLRDLKCPAKLSVNGIECVFCNRCPLDRILKVSKKEGYYTYIVPGSTFLKRILKEIKPNGVFGVACYRDLFEVMNYLSRKGIPVQGQELTKDGCITTTLDDDMLIYRLKNNNSTDD